MKDSLIHSLSFLKPKLWMLVGMPKENQSQSGHPQPAVDSTEGRRNERKYINYLRGLSKENGWEFVKTNKNHYCFTAFVKKNNRYVYISVSDVRFNQNAWYYNVLIRRAEHEKDYTGGRNIYVPLPALAIEINYLLT